MKQNILLKLTMLVMLLGASCSNARVVSARTLDMFYAMLEKPCYSYTVVVLYNENRETRKDCDYKRSLKSLFKTIAVMSQASLYQQGNLQFIKVNVDQDCLDELQSDYAVTNAPAFLLFKNGAVVKNPTTDNRAVLYGFASAGKLRTFIDKYLREDLQQVVDLKIEDRRIRAQMLDYYWGAYWAGGWGYGGPCGAWGYPYGGYPCGGTSFYCGVGGCI
jgi:hypothetical protein